MSRFREFRFSVIADRFLMISLFIFLLLSPSSLTYANDRETPQGPIPAGPSGGATSSPNERIWHVDVNSDCQNADHRIDLVIDEEPGRITDTLLRLTAWDVDYNKLGGCVGRTPEIDHVYLNGKKVGQLQGATDSWSLNAFNISPGDLIKGTNKIMVDTDVTQTGCWCVAIGFVEVVGTVGFEITEFTPAKNSENVLWDKPDIVVKFSDELDTGTINRDTVKLDYRDKSGNWVDVDSTLANPSSKEINLIPTTDLKDGIRYRMRVIGGNNGVKNKSGATLNSTTQWTFWTMINLDGQTKDLYPPNATKDKLQITWFNTLRNKNLVRDKRVVNRIYVLWDKKDDVFELDQADFFAAYVTLDWGTGSKTTPSMIIERPDKYNKARKKRAENTINFDHDNAGGNETYKLTVEPWPQAQAEKRVFKKEAEATTVAARNLKTDVYVAGISGWFNGTDAVKVASAKGMFGDGASYTEEVFPIFEFEYTDKGEIVSGAGGFGMSNVGFEYNAERDQRSNKNSVPGNDAICENVRMVDVTDAGGNVTRLEEVDAVAKHMANMLGGNRFVVGLTPNNLLPITLNSNESCITGRSYPAEHVILLSESNFNESTVAHEVGHEYGLAITTGAGCTNKHNNDGTKIEGFRVHLLTNLANKSFSEGNGEFDETDVNHCDGTSYKTPVVPVMYQNVQSAEFRWMRDDDYNHLFTSIPALMAASALSGDWLVVQGYLDASGAIGVMDPLYRLTQRNIGAPGGSGYTVSLRDASGGVIGGAGGTYTFGPSEFTEMDNAGDEVKGVSKVFIFTIPYDDTAQTLTLTGPVNTKTIDRASYGSAPSGVGFTYPTDGATLTGKVTLSWTGTDDQGKIYYRLEYSPDGIDWTPLAHGLTATTYSVDTTRFSSGANQKLALIAYDGFNSVRKEITISINNAVGVAHVVPGKGAKNVSKGIVSVDFVTPMDASTITNSTFTVKQYNVPVAGSVTYNSVLNRATFTPTDKLRSNTSYTASILGGANGIKDQYGNKMALTYTWTFQTVKFNTPPRVTSTVPKKGTTDISINPAIKVTFDKYILSNTLTTSSFIVVNASGAPASGSVTYDSANNSAIFTPSADLSPNTTYTATVTTAVTDTETPANGLESDYSWSFTTGTTKSSGVVINQVESDSGMDTNGDGFYDVLVIRVQAEVTKPGTFNLNAQLRDQNGLDIQWSSITESFSARGVYSIPLVFDGATIAAHGVDGPYIVTNLYIYSKSTLGVYNAMRGSYQTQPYNTSNFYSAIRLSPIPNISVAQDCTNTDVVNLESYAWHMSLPVSSLTYTKLLDTEPKAGVSINAKHMLDINPTAGFTGSSDVTIELKDSSGNRALYTVRVNVSPAYKFAGPGLYMISLSNQPADTKLSSVLKSIDGKYDGIWGYSNNQWHVYKQGSSLNNLDTIEPGKGYYISMKEAANLTTLGSAITSKTISLTKGWNLVGFNSMEAKPMADALNSIAGRYVAVFAYVNGKWMIYDPNNLAASDLTTMTPGYGYWIYAVSDTNWSLQ